MSFQTQVMIACLVPVTLIVVSCVAFAIHAWWKFR